MAVFEEVLRSNGNNPVALYGLGTETERFITKHRNDIYIAGLLDSFQDNGYLYDYPIISLNKAIDLGVKLIIVVARPGSCKAIAKKIGDICKENGIELFDVRGTDLLQDCKVVYDFKGVKGYKRQELIKAIERADVISFDLFDTLVVRNTFSRSDVFELVDLFIRKKEIVIPDFEKRRIAAEKKLSSGKAPRLEHIYEFILADLKDINISAKSLADMEYQIDCKLLHPREEMISILKLAKSMDKVIFVTSESYYSEEQIQKILDSLGINNIDRLIISCEYNVSKTSGLFQQLIMLSKNHNILHIGDDIVADIEGAENYGINTFQIYSSGELLSILGGLHIEDCLIDISDKIKAGLFISHLLNNPFQFEDDRKRIWVQDVSDVGFLFCAPMIFDFTIWFGTQVMEKQIENIWFGARDGYLIKKIFSKMFPEMESVYFFTSRISAIRAGVFNEQDINYVDSMKFSGTLQENLKVRFGIDVEKFPERDKESSQLGLMKYKKEILEQAQVKRKHNKEYIHRLNVKDGEIAFFDFVAKGTSQMFLQKLVKNKIYGFYFLQLEPEFMKDKDLCIDSFYEEKERAQSAIYDNYYILETLLTAPEPSTDEFDEEGNPVFAQETRTKQDIACFMRAQEGILKYVNEFLKICPREAFTVNKKLDEILLAMVHNVEIYDEDFLKLKVEDPFFNRMTDITDVL